MSLHIVTVATQSQYYFPYLVESCERNGLNLEILGFGEEWKGLNWKFKKMIEYLQVLPRNDLVCFIDGYDVICCRNLREMPNVFYKLKKKHNCKIIVAENKDINIINSLLASFYFGKCNGKLLNSGMYIGLAGDVLNIIQNSVKLDTKDESNDQVILTKYCKKNPKEIYCDIKNELFLSLTYSVHELEPYVNINEKTKKLTYQSNEPFFFTRSWFRIFE